MGDEFEPNKMLRLLNEMIHKPLGVHYLARCEQNLLQTNLSLLTPGPNMPGTMRILGYASYGARLPYKEHNLSNIFRVQLSFTPGSAVASAIPTGDN